MIIAVDAMGGDFAPGNNLLGVGQALERFPGVDRFLLVGDEAVLEPKVNEMWLDRARVEIVHAPEVIGMDESPAKGVRRKKKSSICVCADLLKEKRADAMVSAGNTGAAVAATTIKLRTLPGVDRPGICCPLPNDFGACNILDAGANIEAKPRHLLQYGIMGDEYVRQVLGVEKPRIGLMSVGDEDGKGTEFTREVFALLKNPDLGIHFIGNVEGHDLFEKRIDVVLCDGFVGNVILKSCEATARVMFKWLKNELTSKPWRHLGALMAKGAFQAARERGSYETYGGSPLLGINGVCIICHGSSSPTAIRNAIRVAVDAVDHEVNPHIVERLGSLETVHV